MASFATTQWSLVRSARARATPEGARALEALCQRYWYPLYAFVRRRTADEHQARDLTQAFFARLLERDLLAAADPGRGHFRAFLLTAAKNFLANEREHAAAQKRGGGQAPLSLDFDWGDSRYRREPADPWTPERLFDRQWALVLLDGVCARLRAVYEARGKLPLFEALKPYLAGETGGPTYAEVAATLGLTPGSVKVAVHRLRQSYRDLLLEEVGQTVAGPEAAAEEIRALFRGLES